MLKQQVEEEMIYQQIRASHPARTANYLSSSKVYKGLKEAKSMKMLHSQGDSMGLLQRDMVPVASAYNDWGLNLSNEAQNPLNQVHK